MPLRDRNEQSRVKPAQKSYRLILEQEIIAGLRELRRPTSGLFLSSLSAGLDIGFSVLLMGIAMTLLDGGFGELWPEFVIANAYAVGFILVLLGRSELFTEHTALAVLPVLRGDSSVGGLARVWLVVFGGNIIGACLFAMVLQWFGPALGIIDAAALEEIAFSLLDVPWGVMLCSAIFAGWLMGELGWIIAASRDTISQVVFVWLVTLVIGFAHLHHVVVGTVEVVAGMLVSDQITFVDFLRFLVVATVGNAIGGVVFVACIKYGHASRSSQEDAGSAEEES